MCEDGADNARADYDDGAHEDANADDEDYWDDDEDAGVEFASGLGSSQASKLAAARGPRTGGMAAAARGNWAAAPGGRAVLVGAGRDLMRRPLAGGTRDAAATCTLVHNRKVRAQTSGDLVGAVSSRKVRGGGHALR